MRRQPFGKEPFSWKQDPEYLQQKIEKLEKLHERVLRDEMSVNKDKYGNLLRKHINVEHEVPEHLIESKKKRFDELIRKNVYGDEDEDYHAEEEATKLKKSPLSGYGKQVVQVQTYPPKPISLGNIRSPPALQPARRNTVQNKSVQPKIAARNVSSVKEGKQHQKAESEQQNLNYSNMVRFLYARYGGVPGPDTTLIQMLERQVMETSPNITLDDIADLETAKNLLQQAVLLPLMLPNYFKGIRRPWKGVLMFGPPGTGKTLLAKAVASTGKTKFFNISASSFASKWRGESEKLLLFEMARFYAPSTVFIDEIDSVASHRRSEEDEASRRVKTQLLVQMDGVGGSSQPDNQNKPVIVIAATNRPWDLDEALRRRLEKRIYVPLPKQSGRKQLFQINTKNLKLDAKVDFQVLAKKTKGYSGADLVILIRSASFLPMRRYLSKKGGVMGADDKEMEKQVDVPLTQADFLDALKVCRPSVGTEDLSKYEIWMKQFGSI